MTWYEKDTVLVIQWMMSSCTPTCLTMVMANKIYKHRNKSIHSDYSHLVGSLQQVYQHPNLGSTLIQCSTMAATVSLAFGHCVCVSEGWPVVQFSQALRLTISWNSAEPSRQCCLCSLSSAPLRCQLVFKDLGFKSELGPGIFCFLYVPTFSTMFVSSTACILEVIDGV